MPFLSVALVVSLLIPPFASFVFPSIVLEVLAVDGVHAEFVPSVVAVVLSIDLVVQHLDFAWPVPVVRVSPQKPQDFRFGVVMPRLLVDSD